MKGGGVEKLALIWAGVILGCTFIATPAKFVVRDLTLPVALEIGRATFRAVGSAELLLAIAMLLLLWKRRSSNILFYAAPIILAVEWLLVMPFLDAQTVAEINGRAGGSPIGHLAFLVLELVKLGVLTTMGLRSSQLAPNGRA